MDIYSGPHSKISVHLLCRLCVLYVAGGLFCFSMRELDVKEYEEKMLELEKTEKWKMFSKEKIPYSDNDNLPKEIIAFIFKVLNN